MNIQLQKENIVELPEGFTARGAEINDLEPAMMMFNRWSRSVIGRDELTDLEVFRNDLQSPGFDMAEDIRVVFAPNGQLAGYVEAWTTAKPPVHPSIWGRVDPEYEDRGIGTWLTQWAEQRALQALPNVPAELRFAPRLGTYREADRPKKLFEDLGYHPIRSYYHMLIEMDAPVPEAVFPDGITLRTYDPQTDAEAVYQAQTDSFRDHFGFVDQPFEDGLKHFKHFWEDETSDPSLMFLAMDGPSGEIAGINLCRPQSFEDADMGWVGTLGVRRPWRKRGLGLAFLHHAFNEFYRRGKRKVGLGVDAENLTGALRLYENAGMHVHQTFDLYEKELRAGTEISVQSLSE
ncbi:MAG TPA: GNAT family N-acetyltransferase [Anaerolineales bacterium]|nr:GNAT family N-acetyltransferase [Anaerolineales bacterium]